MVNHQTRNTSASLENIYLLDGRVPLLKSVPFGLQHVLAMFVANIAPIMIVAASCNLDAATTASLIQTAMIMAGIGTLVQLFSVWKLGARLPIVMGISFTFVSIFCYVGPQYGYEAIIGGVIVGGIIEGLLGFCAKYWRKIISPIVAALASLVMIVFAPSKCFEMSAASGKMRRDSSGSGSSGLNFQRFAGFSIVPL